MSSEIVLYYKSLKYSKSWIAYKCFGVQIYLNINLYMKNFMYLWRYIGKKCFIAIIKRVLMD